MPQAILNHAAINMRAIKTQNDKQSDAKAMWLSALFGICLLFSIFAVALTPKAGSKVAVINLPWSTQNEAIFTIAHADANIAAVGAVNWVAIAADNNIQGTNSNLIERLYQAGAFLVVDAALLISCGIIST